ncbi:MAG: amidohydrolase family protein [Clostridia bacterium]|nr:amidohydrolase family protein [Clostridia bacterium]
MLKEKVIDSHVHVEAFFNEESDFVNCFENYRNNNGLATFNICVVPTKQRNVCNNMMAGFYKLAHPYTYAHCGVDHIYFPNREEMPEGMDLVTQYKELMEMGFDGVKMLEAKPSHHKKNGSCLLPPSMVKLFKEIEKDGTHLLLHSNDPEEFWDERFTTDEMKQKGWFYGDGTYATHEEIYKETEELLALCPNLKVTLAHFYFCGEKPEKLASLLDKYPNLCVDITQGGEMYIAFEKRTEYFKDFFIKYSDRIMLGTDSTFPWGDKVYDWLIDRTYRFVATGDYMMAFADHNLTGINLPKEERENILYKNFERRVSPKPKAINKELLLRYVEKYKCLLSDEEWKFIEPHYTKLANELKQF